MHRKYILTKDVGSITWQCHPSIQMEGMKQNLTPILGEMWPNIKSFFVIPSFWSSSGYFIVEELLLLNWLLQQKMYVLIYRNIRHISIWNLLKSFILILSGGSFSWIKIHYSVKLTVLSPYYFFSLVSLELFLSTNIWGILYELIGRLKQ